jgi:Secretion system C-terminal sorting domain
MKNKQLKLCVALVFGVCLSNLHAQTSTNTTGGVATGSGGTVSYSVGQLVHTTNAGSNGSVTQGVQQAYEISVVNALEEATAIRLSAYPNPTTDYLTLEVDASTLESDHQLSYQLLEINGILLQNAKITGSQTSIMMSNLAPATYFVKITNGDKDVKTFKILKK